jgi:hypothetical protein
VAAFDAGKVHAGTPRPVDLSASLTPARMLGRLCRAGVPGFANSQPLAATASSHLARRGSILGAVANWDTRRGIFGQGDSENLSAKR